MTRQKGGKREGKQMTEREKDVWPESFTTAATESCWTGGTEPKTWSATIIRLIPIIWRKRTASSENCWRPRRQPLDHRPFMWITETIFILATTAK